MYFLFLNDILKNIFVSLAYFILRILYVVHMTQDVLIGYIISKVSSQLVLKVWGSQLLYADSRLCRSGGVNGPKLTPALFKGQLY